jgi:hypothetical protein
VGTCLFFERRKLQLVRQQKELEKHQQEQAAIAKEKKDKAAKEKEKRDAEKAAQASQRLTRPEYQALLQQNGYPQCEIIDNDGQGDCFFRAVSHQLYGSDHHLVVRQAVIDYMVRWRGVFAHTMQSWLWLLLIWFLCCHCIARESQQEHRRTRAEERRAGIESH